MNMNVATEIVTAAMTIDVTTISSCIAIYVYMDFTDYDKSRTAPADVLSVSLFCCCYC